MEEMSKLPLDYCKYRYTSFYSSILLKLVFNAFLAVKVSPTSKRFPFFTKDDA